MASTQEDGDMESAISIRKKEHGIRGTALVGRSLGERD
jgi:hypothetical protein